MTKADIYRFFAGEKFVAVSSNKKSTYPR